MLADNGLDVPDVDGQDDNGSEKQQHVADVNGERLICFCSLSLLCAGCLSE